MRNSTQPQPALPLAQHVYVYYRTSPSLAAKVLAMFAALTAQVGHTGRLLQQSLRPHQHTDPLCQTGQTEHSLNRRADPGAAMIVTATTVAPISASQPADITWMEVFEYVPADFASRLQAALIATQFAQQIGATRHEEWFTETTH